MTSSDPTEFTDSISPGTHAEDGARLGDLVPRGIEAALPKIDTSWLAGVDALSPALNASWLRGIEAALPKIDTSWLAGVDALSPALNASWLRGIEAALPKIDTSWLAGVDALSPAFDTSWLFELTDAVRLRVRGLPANWSAVQSTDVLDDEMLHSIVLDEGIPLAWVPGAALIERLLAAEDGRERRELIRSGWRGVIRDCVQASAELPSRQARTHARFIAACASAIGDGHYEAAQALAANLVDTLGQKHVKASVVGINWNSVTAKNQRGRLSSLTLRALLVLGPLAVGHAHYRPNDVIPRAFSRHATAHGVSRRQYTRVNSLLALMNATALLCWLERDTVAFVEN